MNPPGFAAIVLAAGQGTRMKSALPKVLHPAGRAADDQPCPRPAGGDRLRSDRAGGRPGRAMAAVEHAVAPWPVAIQPRRAAPAMPCGARASDRRASPATCYSFYGDAPLIGAATLQRLVAPPRRAADPAGAGAAAMQPDDAAAYGRVILDARRRHRPKSSSSARRPARPARHRPVQFRRDGGRRRPGCSAGSARSATTTPRASSTSPISSPSPGATGPPACHEAARGGAARDQQPGRARRRRGRPCRIAAPGAMEGGATLIAPERLPRRTPGWAAMSRSAPSCSAPGSPSPTRPRSAASPSSRAPPSSAARRRPVRPAAPGAVIGRTRLVGNFVETKMPPLDAAPRPTT